MSASCSGRRAGDPPATGRRRYTRRIRRRAGPTKRRCRRRRIGAGGHRARKPGSGRRRAGGSLDAESRSRPGPAGPQARRTPRHSPAPTAGLGEGRRTCGTRSAPRWSRRRAVSGGPLTRKMRRCGGHGPKAPLLLHGLKLWGIEVSHRLTLSPCNGGSSRDRSADSFGPVNAGCVGCTRASESFKLRQARSRFHSLRRRNDVQAAGRRKRVGTEGGGGGRWVRAQGGECGPIAELQAITDLTLK